LFVIKTNGVGYLSHETTCSHSFVECDLTQSLSLHVVLVYKIFSAVPNHFKYGQNIPFYFKVSRRQPHTSHWLS